MGVTNKISIATSKVEEAIKRFGSNPGIVLDTTKTTVNVDTGELPKEFLKELMCCQLTAGQKTLISAAMGDLGDCFDGMVSNPSQLSKVLKQLEHPEKPTVEIEIGDRWYPVKLQGVDFRSDAEFGGSWCSFNINVQICDQAITKYFSFSKADFTDDLGSPVQKTARQVLEENGIRPTTAERVESFKRDLVRAEQIRGKTAMVLDVMRSVLASNKLMWRSTLDVVRLGTEERPKQVIVEPDLERQQDNHGGYAYGSRGSAQELPFVRAFSMDLKKYVYVDVTDVKEHQFAQEDARKKLVLPGKMHALLNSVFEGSAKDLFGDMFAGRHGGMVVLANGPTGVGKTLTAEVFAEYTKRPLYILEMGELGTNLSAVEENLQKVFARATRWNAVLLFDECDVFLAKREETDLERSAIVGVFLRLLDRYEGMFFLTSNRGEVIDPAFKGRITLKMDYPELSPESRQKVWESMLSAAKLRVEGDIREVCEEKINGRQIRNQVRLLKLTHPDGRVSVKDIKESFEYLAK